MLDKFIDQLGQELKMDAPITSPNKKEYELSFVNSVVKINQFDQAIIFKGTIGECPKNDSEAYILKIMEANLFGTGTRGGVIGLKENENLLTLTLTLDYNSSYREFKDKLEDFISVINYWQTEASIPSE